MNYIRYDWFLCVVESGGISKAAEKLFVSQQSVSAYIKRIETSCNTILFDRTNGFSLTAQGAVFYRYAKQIVERENALRAMYQNINANTHGRIRFGLTTARSRSLLSRILPDFQKQYPNVSISLYEEHTASLSQRINSRTIDLYYGKDILVNPYISKEILAQDHYYAIATTAFLQRHFSDAHESKLSNFRKGVYLSELRELPFITIDPSRKVARPIDLYCREHSIELHSDIQVSRMSFMIDLCRAGLGIGICLGEFLPHALQSQLSDPNDALVVFPILDDLSLSKVILASYSEATEPEYFTAFKDAIRKSVQSMQIG